jgi:hypothetical protein
LFNVCTGCQFGICVTNDQFEGSVIRCGATVDERKIKICCNIDDDTTYIFIGYPVDNTFERFQQFQFQQVQVIPNPNEKSIDEIGKNTSNIFNCKKSKT